MDETSSPPPCPKTVTIRRNPHRRARPTPSSVAPIPMPLSPSSISHNIPSFPTDEILSIQLPPNPNNLSPSDSLSAPESENLRVFLRIRPLAPNGGVQINKQHCKNGWPKSKHGSREKAKKRTEICVSGNDYKSVTVSPPASLQEGKRVKTEVYGGFSQVFSAESTQDEVYAKMVNPLVEEFLRGKSGMLAALGPSGSGKTHTVFGSPREPGMVPLTLRRIFSRTEGCETQLSRIFYLSMFEICSERGKAERLIDLFQDVGDLCMQQSTVKGVQEVSVTNVQQAESLVACGTLKRATARTNSNNQSSRSQCIINIRGSPHSAVFTVVDLAGAEREKRTGNQGARLLESNFINNTSMVFGLCLRSLLEHQKNPKKPLQKHFQNSLLTRYLRDYLEGKRRMALILTVKSGVEDYLDTSFLLRQASPYMKIKFNNAEEPLNLVSTKRSFQAFPRVERLKRTKLSSIEAFHTNEGNGAGDGCRLLKEEALPPEIIKPEHCSGRPGKTTNSDLKDGTSLEEGSTELEKERKNVIMQNFAKAIWNVLKQYKEKLKVAENQIQTLNRSLTDEKERSLGLEIELKDLKSNLLYKKETSLKERVESSTNTSAEQEGCQSDHEVNNAGVVIASSITVEDFEEQGYQFTNQESEAFPRDVNIAEDPNDEGTDDTQFDRNGSDSGPSEYVVSSPKSLIEIRSDSCSSVERSKSESEEDKKRLDQPTMPEEGAELPPRCDASSATKSDSKDNSSSRALNAERPKRSVGRLLPASSILLKNISTLEFEDEYEKPKGGRGEKKLVLEERNRTQGSISLLRLLRTNLHL
ncbi:kinesin-like protein KIN-6 isoform X2 [Rhododendron vialii]|uniref:kinesin-like protein KIN-6 isoform X2 n=1 Tax=Rhododendron vialii TaxID=182163 RepID=UPI00265E6A73|nr:kinesin-like protein KIN-6 isoform X2 [Rhododendron vialii]